MPESPFRSPQAVVELPTHMRHAIVLVTTATAVMLYLTRVCLGQAAPSMSEELGLGPEQMGLVLGAFFWTYALGQVPAGWLSDRFGARPMLTAYVVVWSIFTCCVGMADWAVIGLSGALGMAPALIWTWMLVGLRGAVGVGQAGAYPTAGSLLSRWVEFRNRGLASGVVSSGGRIGGILAPALTALLIGLLGGWRGVFIVYGLVGLLVGWMYWVVFRDRPEEHPWCNEAEQAIIREGQPPRKHLPPPRGVPLRALATSRSMWLMCLTQFGTNVGWVFLVTWLPTYLQSVHNLSDNDTGLLNSLILAIGMIGMLSGGSVTDWATRHFGLRWGRAAPVTVTRFLAAAAFLAAMFIDSVPGVVACFCAVALFTDLGTPSMWAYMQDVGGRQVGSVLGWGNMWGNFGAAIAPSLVAAVIVSAESNVPNWPSGFLVCAAGFIVSGVASLGIDARQPIADRDA